MTEINECYQSYEDLNDIENNQINRTYNNIYNTNNTIEVPCNEQNAVINSASIILRRSDSRNSLHRRSITNLILNKFNILSKLSVSSTDKISIEPNSLSENDCIRIDGDESDVNEDTKNSVLHVKQSVTVPILVVNCDKSSNSSSSEMASSSPIMSSASVFDKGLFNIARVKKVELQDLSPKVSDLTCKLKSFCFFKFFC